MNGNWTVAGISRISRSRRRHQQHRARPPAVQAPPLLRCGKMESSAVCEVDLQLCASQTLLATPRFLAGSALTRRTAT